MKIDKPTVLTVATAHLDTIWNWNFEQTIRDYIPKTLDKNFYYFKKYPDYVFSFEGSRRYELMEEYYPEKFNELKKYIADGRWFVTGSAYENGDVNVPSPEALFRNILIGNSYFTEKFGKKSVDIYLPDCFGFGYALPSIANHAGLYGFTTQKLTWSSAYGIPFDLGYWQGVDGSRIFASLDAQDYNGTLMTARNHKNSAAKLEKNIKEYDLPITYLLHGVGDRGGAPREPSVKTVVKEKKQNGQNKVNVEIVSVDEAFRTMKSELSDEQKQKLPVWDNELVSTNHGVGGYTSRAIGKRWNKKNEQLADAAERTACTAEWLGASKYPENVLSTAWKRVIAHQFHDDLPGTSLQQCYKRSWNDYVLSLNNFAGEYTTAAGKIISLMKKPEQSGITVAVSNPTQWDRKDAVECDIPMLAKARCISVKNCNGEEVPSQISNGKVIFTAFVPQNGIALFTVAESKKPYSKNSGMSVSNYTIENRKYKVALDENGDISSVLDKELNKELLSAPVRMAVHKYNGNHDYPAWELDYPEVMAEPVGYAKSPVFFIEEDGAARCVIKTIREYGESVFEQKISLGENSSSIRIDNEIEWRSSRSLLKTPFSFTVKNEQASYDLGLGVIKRGVNTEKLYEVPGQNWADISDESFGVSVLSDCKYGWDHPAADTLRLTGIHTPRGNYRKDSQQSYMDMGKNRYAFGIFSHSGSDLQKTQSEGAMFSQPMCVFSVPDTTAGILPSEFSFSQISDDGVIIRAIKKEQDGTRIIVRVNEGTGKEHKNVKLKLGDGIQSAVEMLASEEETGEAQVKNGQLVFSIKPYEPKTFALILKPFGKEIRSTETQAVRLSYNASVTSENSKKTDGIMGGYTVPTELMPKKITCKGITYELSQTKNNALKCCGQQISIPNGCKFISLLVASTAGDKNAVVRMGESKETIFIPDCFEAVGAWDLYSMGEKGYIKDCTLAYEFTHMHKAAGDEYAKQCYLFKADVKADAKTMTLPVDENIIIFAATAVFDDGETKALHPIYDTLKKEEFTFKRSSYESNISNHENAVYSLEKLKAFKKLINKL